MSKNNDLVQYVRGNINRPLIDKYLHYLDIYDKYFERYRGKTVNILEFGVSQGGSVKMWKYYFGDSCNIYAVDINPECLKFEEDRINIFIGDQSSRSFLRNLKLKLPDIDIVIDDGGHSMKQQIITLEEMFGIVNKDGLYLIEDLHTSYWEAFGGGLKTRIVLLSTLKK